MTRGDRRNAVAPPVWKWANSASRLSPWCHALNVLDWTRVCLKFRVQQMYCYITGALLSPLKVLRQTKTLWEVWQDFSFLLIFPISQKTWDIYHLVSKASKFPSNKHISSHVWIGKKESIKFFFNYFLLFLGRMPKGKPHNVFFLKMLFFCLFNPGDTAPSNIPPCGALKHKLHRGSQNTVNDKCCFIFITLWIINSRLHWHHGFHQNRCIDWGG